ncbi:MAG: HipA domain-containing protein [Bacteroidales bacterium]|nr:HipA domain-containing protein [Bacteroidales bacterium]
MKLEHIEFSKDELQNLFNGKFVSADTEICFKPNDFNQHVKHFSISGVQEKMFAVEDNGILRLAKDGEQSTFIIKPTPINDYLAYRDEMSINEYLTMQIANKIFGIKTAPCALIRLQDKRPALIVKRFDIQNNTNGDFIKLQQEDICSLLGKTAQKDGSDFKYQGSYLDMAKCLKNILPTWHFEIQKFLSIIIFNYLFSNGDAHSKNFSIIRKLDGSITLSPAYDLLCTSLHIKDSDFAMNNGLGTTIHSEYFEKTGHSTAEDFIIFGKECGLTDKQINKIIQPFLLDYIEIETIINNSLLSKKCQKIYLRAYQQRLNFLRRK